MVTKKITLNELRTIVKQIIKEEVNEGVFDLFKTKKINKDEIINKLKSIIIPSGSLTDNMADKAIQALNSFNNDIIKRIEIDKELYSKLERTRSNLAPNKYGMNRSTNDFADIYNLYLGDTDGLKTKPLVFWLSKKDDKKIMEIIGNQLSNWINSNIEFAIETIQEQK